MTLFNSAKILTLTACVALLSACSDADVTDVAIGAAAVVIADRIVENQNGGDGLF